MASAKSRSHCGERGEQRQVAVGAEIGGADLAGKARAHMLGDHLGRAAAAGDLGDAFEDGRQVADRDALVEQRLQDALDAGDGNLAGHNVLEQLLLILAEAVEQRLHVGVAQEVRDVGLEHFGEVRGDDRRGIDDRVALEFGFIAQRRLDPCGGQAEGRLGRVVSRAG